MTLPLKNPEFEWYKLTSSFLGRPIYLGKKPECFQQEELFVYAGKGILAYFQTQMP